MDQFLFLIDRLVLSDQTPSSGPCLTSVCSIFVTWQPHTSGWAVLIEYLKNCDSVITWGSIKTQSQHQLQQQHLFMAREYLSAQSFNGFFSVRRACLRRFLQISSSYTLPQTLVQLDLEFNINLNKSIGLFWIFSCGISCGSDPRLPTPEYQYRVCVTLYIVYYIYLYVYVMCMFL